MVVSWISLISTQRIASNAPAYPPGARGFSQVLPQAPWSRYGLGEGILGIFLRGQASETGGQA